MSGDKLTVTEAGVDGGFDGASVEAAETLWACLPHVRKWTSLATHEKALVIHTLARHRTNTTTELVEALKDPNAVHVNMLWGGIAKPSLAQIIHIYGRDALEAALHNRGES